MNESQLLQFEESSECTFFSKNSHERNNASLYLLNFCKSAESIRDLIFVITKSKNYYAFNCACNLLTNIFTKFFNSLSKNDRKEIRKLLYSIMEERMDWLTSSQSTHQSMARDSFCVLCCRVWRLCWFELSCNSESDYNKELVCLDDPSIHELALKILDSEAKFSYLLMAICILNHTLSEFRNVLDTIPLSDQRKISISFKQNNLLFIFNKCLDWCEQLTLHMNLNDDSVITLLNGILELAQSVLNYCYEAAYPNESNDDDDLINVNELWSELINNSIIFFKILRIGSFSIKGLDILVNLLGLQPSGMKTELKNNFLNSMITNLIIVLRENFILNNETNIHSFVKIFHRLQLTYKISVLTQNESYINLLNLYSEFCKALFLSGNFNPNTSYYILKFWAQVSSYYNDKGKNTFEEYKLVQYFTDYVLKEDSNYLKYQYLEDTQVFRVLHTLPNLIKGDKRLYICNYLSDLSLGLYSKYRESLMQFNSNTIQLLERQLAWIIHISNAIIHDNSSKDAEDDLIDAELTSNIFHIMKLYDEKIEHFGKNDYTKWLEYSIVLYLRRFSSHFFSTEAVEISNILAEKHQFINNDQILEFLIRKISNNLRIWNENPLIIDESLEIFQSLTTKRESIISIENSALVKSFLDGNHEIEMPLSKKYKITFYKYISKIIFSDIESKVYQDFIISACNNIQLLQQQVQVKNANILKNIENLIYKLRGILSACTTDRSYRAFFDWFYEYYESFIGNSLLIALQSDLDSSLTILRFISQFSHNSNNRIAFSNSSPNSLKLFKSTASMLIHLGEFILNFSENGSLYSEDMHYKLSKQFMKIFGNLIGSTYIPFGIIFYYDDDIFMKLLSIAINIIYSIPFDTLFQYSDVCHAYYKGIEALCTFNLGEMYFYCRDSVNILPPIETSKLLLDLIKKGINSRDASIVKISLNSLEALISINLKAAKNSIRIIDGSHEHILNVLFIETFDILIHSKDIMATYASKALFKLILLNPKSYISFKTALIESQYRVSQDKGSKAQQILNDLDEDVEFILDRNDQEKFCNNAIYLSNHIKSFIDLISYYVRIGKFEN